jgi:hypothetical protein
MFNAIISGAQPQLGGTGGAFNTFGPPAQQVASPADLFAPHLGQGQGV